MHLRILIFAILIIPGIVWASPEIMSWSNDHTGNASTGFSVTIGTTVIFSAAANETVRWNWTIDGADQANDGPNWTHAFSIQGTFLVGVNATNTNGTTRTLNWTITASLPPTPPNMTSWSNNITIDRSLEVAVNTTNTITFNATADQAITTWTWTLDGVDQGADRDSWTHVFSPYGTYNVSVLGTNANGSTKRINWSVSSTLWLMDALGNNVSVTRNPQRIVSLAPSNTEILFALGLGDRVIGVTDYCNYPPEATGKTSVGGFTNPNVESVEILEPDIILASSGNDAVVVNKLVDDCKVLNCTVFSLEADSMDAIVENIRTVGSITGADPDTLAEGITQRLRAVEGNTSGIPTDQKPRTFYVIWDSPLYTGGNETFAGDMVLTAGGLNIASDTTGWNMMNPEVVLARDPEVLICSGMGGSGNTICENIKNDAALKFMSAVADDKMYVIGDPNIIERPGPRIASGLERMYALLNFPNGSVNSVSVAIGSPQATSYLDGSTISLSYTSNATNPAGFYRLDDGFITSFESDAASISPGAGSHTLTIWVMDPRGTWGSSSVSFTMYTPPPPTTSTGGNPGGSPPKIEVTTESGKTDVSIPYIGAGSMVSVEIPGGDDVDVTEVSIKASQNVRDATVTIRSLDSRPSDVSSGGDTVYRYMEIDHRIGDEKIQEAIIKFKVERAWFPGDAKGEDVVLKRYHEGGWTALKTQRLREDPTYFYYSGTTPGFSYFAIALEEPGIEERPHEVLEEVPPIEKRILDEEPEETPVPTPEPDPKPGYEPMEKPQGTPVPSETTDEKGICGPTLILLFGTIPVLMRGMIRR